MRVGHISDLHLRRNLQGTSAVPARLSRDMPELLSAALSAMMVAGVDVVVVTGDLVDHPYPVEDTPETLRNGRADLQLVAEALQQLSCPWAVLPGNHDHPELFRDVFGLKPHEFDCQGIRFTAFHDWDRSLVADDDEMATNVPRRIGAERTRFEALLADDDSRPQVHLQHYVITPRLDEGWPHTYADGEYLCDAVVQDGRIRLALSGHYHPGSSCLRAGDNGMGTWFNVAPAFCEIPHPYLLHDLGSDGCLVTTRVELKPDSENLL